MAFSADILHEGHINIINKASKLGKLVVGLLTDEAISSFKNIPFLNYNQKIFDNKKYKKNIESDSANYT